jgi:carbamoyltransferase
VVNEHGTVLGLSFDYHDAAAAVLVEGVVVAAAAEERFSRVKHDRSLPVSALRWCLEEAAIEPGELDLVVFYEKPVTKLERVLRDFGHRRPTQWPAAARTLTKWGGSNLRVRTRISDQLRELGHGDPPVLFAEHHLSHAAAAYYPSPFDRAVILTFDAVGEHATSAIGRGNGSHLELLTTLNYPDSIGLIYSVLTDFCGFDVNDGEYKLMGLAPYGEPRYVERLRDRLVQVLDDGSIHVDLRYVDYQRGARMSGRRLASLLDGPARTGDAPVGQREADIARSAQVLLEEIVTKVARHARSTTGERQACLAGGVALNAVANQRLRELEIFDDLWVQPAAGDDGGAVGAALWGWHQILGRPRSAAEGGDRMRGAFLGPAFTPDSVRSSLDRLGVSGQRLDDEDALVGVVASELAAGSVVGWFQGRMEFGPRALGNRSILADPRHGAQVGKVNREVKGREGFRPFAPAVLAEEAASWFQVAGPRPYMTETVRVLGFEEPSGDDESRAPFRDRLARVESPLPACTHVDGSARVQTVSAASNPRFHALLTAFHELTGCPVLVNTSFNRAGEPIVCTPEDAVATFAATAIDVLVVEDVVVRRTDLPVADPR